MSKLNRMDEKLDLLSRKVTMLSNKSTGGGVGYREVPSVPEGMTLPADSVRDLKSVATISRTTDQGGIWYAHYTIFIVAILQLYIFVHCGSVNRKFTILWVWFYCLSICSVSVGLVAVGLVGSKLVYIVYADEARYLSTFASTTVADYVYSMMKALMTNALSRQFNWSGTKDKNNSSALGIATIICDAVRMNDSMSSVVNKVVEDEIKIWLMQARDREVGRKRRFLSSASKISDCVAKRRIYKDMATDYDDSTQSSIGDVESVRP